MRVFVDPKAVFFIVGTEMHFEVHTIGIGNRRGEGEREREREREREKERSFITEHGGRSSFLSSSLSLAVFEMDILHEISSSPFCLLSLSLLSLSLSLSLSFFFFSIFSPFLPFIILSSLSSLSSFLFVGNRTRSRVHIYKSQLEGSMRMWGEL